MRKLQYRVGVWLLRRHLARTYPATLHAHCGESGQATTFYAGLVRHA